MRSGPCGTNLELLRILAVKEQQAVASKPAMSLFDFGFGSGHTRLRLLSFPAANASNNDKH